MQKYVARKQRFAVKAVCNNCDLVFLKSKSLGTVLTVKSADLKLVHDSRGFRWKLEVLKPDPYP